MTKLTVKLAPEQLLKLKDTLEEGKRKDLCVNDQKEQKTQHRDQKSGFNEHLKNNKKSEPLNANLRKSTKDDDTKTEGVKKEIKQQRFVPFARNQRVMHALDWLYVTFPKLFKKQEKVPLKVGILYDIFVWLDAHRDNLAEENCVSHPTKTAIRDAVRFYTMNTWYQKALVEQDKRYNLEGVPVDDVQELHKARATEHYLRIEEKIKTKNEKRDAYRAKRKTREAEKENKMAMSDVPVTENAMIQHKDKTAKKL
jgi:sRNA-binding protein